MKIVFALRSNQISWGCICHKTSQSLHNMHKKLTKTKSDIGPAISAGFSMDMFPDFSSIWNMLSSFPRQLQTLLCSSCWTLSVQEQRLCEKKCLNTSNNFVAYLFISAFISISGIHWTWLQLQGSILEISI